MSKLSCAILAVFALAAALDGTAIHTRVAAQTPRFPRLPPMDAPANPNLLIPGEPYPPDEMFVMVLAGRNTIFTFNWETLEWESRALVYPSNFQGGLTLAGGGSPGFAPALFVAPSGASTLPMVMFNMGPPMSPPEEIGTLPGAAEYGYRFTVGDLVADSTLEFVAATGPGGPAGVHVFAPGTNETMTVYPFGPDYRDGFNLATGDINGNGRKDLLIAQARGRVFTALEFTDLRSDPLVLGSGDFFGPTFLGGANIAAFDFNRDRFDEVVFGAGDGAPLVRIVNFNGPTPTLAYQFTAGPATASEGVRVDVGLRNGSPVIATLTDVTRQQTRQELVVWLYEQAETPVFKPSFEDVPLADSEAFFKFIQQIRR